QPLFPRELAERVRRRMAEIEMKPAKRRHPGLRDLPPLLIDDFPTRLRRAETRVGRTIVPGFAESVVVCHGHQMVTRGANASYVICRAAVGVSPKRRRKQRLK